MHFVLQDAPVATMVAPKFTFQVKVINPQNTGGYVIQEWVSKKYDKRKELEAALVASFGGSIDSRNFQFGFIAPDMVSRGSKC